MARRGARGPTFRACGVGTAGALSFYPAFALLGAQTPLHQLPPDSDPEEHRWTSNGYEPFVVGAVTASFGGIGPGIP